MLTDTVVTLLPNGTIKQETYPISAGELRAQLARRMAIARGEEQPNPEPNAEIAQEIGCPTDAFWLYSRFDFTGSRICFQGAGTVLLDDYVRLVGLGPAPLYMLYWGTWALEGGSYYAGTRGGRLYNPRYGIVHDFVAWGSKSAFGSLDNSDPRTHLQLY